MKRLKAALLAAMLLCLALSVSPASGEDGVRLVCLNVGKGDCLLLFSGDGAYLIDTGAEYAYPALETALKHYGVTRLDAVFLTHCHVDHAGGMERLSKSDIAVGAWYASPFHPGVEPGGHPAVLAAARRGETAVFLSAGMVIAAEGGAFTVLGPLSEDTENENNNSLVLRFDSPHGSMLLTGDMKADEEAELLYAGKIAPADILKVGHHGDSGATTAALLTAAAPKVALISTLTAEEPDTPARSTLARIQGAGARAYVTQDAESALVATLKRGDIAVEYAAWEELPARAQGVSMTIDVENDVLTVLNASDTSLSLDGCTLVSVRGGEWFALGGAAVPPGGALTVGTKTTKVAADLTLPDKRVWHKSKRDAALLYDGFGRLIAVTDNGMPE